MGEKYVVEGYWDCSSCKSKGIRGRFRECPNCGKPRSKDVQFYLREFDKEHALENVSGNPDWFCEYCFTYNPDSADTCLSCGANRSNKTYSDFRNTSSFVKIDDTDKNGIDDTGEISEAERDKINHQRELDDNAKRHEEINKEFFGNKAENNPVPKSNKLGFAILGILFFVGLLIYNFMPKTVDVEVEDMFWVRHVNISQLQTVSESGWEVPPNARVFDKREKIHHTNHVLDHYETYYETVEDRVVDHYKTVQKKRDLGNGNFEIDSEQEPVYKTVTRKEEKQRPVYKDVPVYQTKYYYKLERWKHHRSVESSAHDKNPYYGEYTLSEGIEPYNIGQEKVSGYQGNYFIKGIINGKEESIIVDDEEWWNEINVGDTVHGKLTKDNRLVRE